MAAIAAIALCILIQTDVIGQPLFVEQSRTAVPPGCTRFVSTQEGDLILLFRGADRIAIRTARDSTFRFSGGFGWELDAFDEPSNLSTDGLSVYIADRNNHRIIRSDRGLRPLTSFQTRDTSFTPAAFGYPNGTDVNAKGDLAILDGESQDLVVFDAFGRFLFRFGNDARAGRLFREPSDVSHDAAGNWLLTDAGRLWKVDAFGNLLGSTVVPSGTSGAVSAASDFIAVSGPDTIAIVSTDLQRTTLIPVRQIRIDGGDQAVLDLFAEGETVMLLFRDAIVTYAIEYSSH